MTDWTRLRYAVVDVEGNGRQPPDLVELAVVPIIGGTIMQPKSWLVRPDTPISYVATRIHGITNQQLIDAPVFSDVEAEICQVLDNTALIAHNAHVDVRLLRHKLGGWECPEVFDTLKLARRLMPEREIYKLGALATALSLDEGLPRRSHTPPSHLRHHRHGAPIHHPRHPRHPRRFTRNTPEHVTERR